MRESERRLANILENVQDAYFRADLDGRLAMVSPSAARMYGYASPAEMIGLRARDLYADPAERESVFEELERTGRVHDRVGMGRKKDGTEFWVSLNTQFYKDEQGRVLGSEGFIRDITERKRAEEALRENRALMKDVLDNSSSLVYIVDGGGRFLFANRRLEALFGVAEGGATGRTRESFLPRDVAEQHTRNDRQVFREGKSISVEEENAEPDGAHVYSSVKFPLRDARGRIYAVGGMSTDVTERKRAEEALRWSETQLQVTLESTADGILAVDNDGRVIKANRRFAEIWRIPDSIMASGDDRTLLGYVIDQLVDPDAFSKRVQGLYHTDAVSTDTLLFKDGRMFERLSSPMTREGLVVGRVWSFRDVTERTRAREALEESEARFHAVADLTYGMEYWQAPDGSLVYVSPSCEHTTGYRAEEFSRDPDLLIRIVHPDDRGRFAAHHHVERGERSGPDHHDLDLRIVTRGGEVRWINHSCRRVYSRDGAYMGRRVSDHDITERKRAEDLKAAIYEISEAAQQAARLDDLFAAVHRIVGRLMEARNFRIALYDSNTNLISFPYFVDEMEERPAPFPAEKGLTSFVVRTGEALLATPKVLRDLEERREVERLGAASLDWLGVPLTVQGRVIGVLTVQSYRAQAAYTEAEKGILVYVSAQVAQAIERKRAEEALRESEDRYRDLVEQSGDLICTHDLAGRFVSVNSASARVSGYSIDELLTMSLQDLLAPEVKDQSGSYFGTVRNKGRAKGFMRIVTKSGERRIWEYDNTLRTEGVAEPVVRGLARDVTDRIQVEEMQAAIYEISEAAQRAGGLDDLYVEVHRIVGRLMDARNFYIALYDPAENLVDLPYFVDEEDLTPPPAGARRGLTEYVIRTGQPLLATPEVFDELCRCGEVESIGAPSIDWLGVPLVVGNQTIGALVVQTYREGVRYGERERNILTFVSRQVAQAIARKRAEEALKESEEKHRTLVDNMQEGVAVIRGGKVLFANPALARMAGMTVEEVVRHGLMDFIAPEDRSAFTERFWRRTDEVTGPGEYEVRGLHSDGVTRVDLHVQTGRIVYEGKPATLATVRDLTEQKRLEEHLLQSQKMEAVGSLAGGVAHDFNNLLQALLSQAEHLRAYADDPERVKGLGFELAEQINRGASLTRQLLLFSRRETTKRELLDLNDSVRGATSMLRRLVRANIALEIALAPEALAVEADRGQLDQVLMNLTVNASDAMPAGGTLVVRTGALGGDRVWLSVEDTGNGIPGAIRERIFEPFFSTKDAGKGTGLGLAVVHGIVTRHGGRIEVESVEGQGAVFKVILPAAGATPVPVAQEAPQRTAELPVGNGERILVVEDEDAARKALCEILRSLGYEVVAAASGEEAGVLPAAEPFDVVLSDLMLPGIGGAQLVVGLQELWPSMKIILMSGYTEDEAVRRGISEGNSRFLQKPFDMGHLAREIRAALEE